MASKPASVDTSLKLNPVSMRMSEHEMPFPTHDTKRSNRTEIKIPAIVVPEKSSSSSLKSIKHSTLESVTSGPPIIKLKADPATSQMPSLMARTALAMRHESPVSRGFPNESPTSRSVGRSVGGGGATGLGQILAKMAEQETVLASIEERLMNHGEELIALNSLTNEMKRRSEDAYLKAQRAIEMADEASKKITAILGDSNSMQSFVASTSKEVQNLKKKVTLAEKLHEKLIEDMSVRFAKNEKVLSEADKRSLIGSVDI